VSRLDQLGVAARLTLPRRQGAGLASAIAAPPPPTGPSQVSGVVWPQTLATERLLMRPLQVSDRREFLRAVRESRDAAARFMPLLLPNESEHDAFSRQLAQREAGDLTGRDWRRIAVDRTGRIVGGFNVNDIRRGLENRGEITLWVHPGVAGRGLATEGLAALVEMALAPLVPRAAGEQSRAARGGLGLTCVRGLISPDNAASIRLVKRLGFVLEPASAPIELILGGAAAPHDEYVRYATPLGEAASRVVRTLHELPAFMRRDIRKVLRLESASNLRVF